MIKFKCQNVYIQTALQAVVTIKKVLSSLISKIIFQAKINFAILKKLYENKTSKQMKDLSLKKLPSTNSATNQVFTSSVPSKPLLEEKIPEIFSEPSSNSALVLYPNAGSLIETYAKCWNVNSKKFNPIPFKESQFIALAKHHIGQFEPIHNPATDYGYIENKILPKGSKIFVRADLHGDLKSLIENLRNAQQQGLLDKNYKCLPGTQLVFLGDYGDRGNHSMEVLQLLLTLKAENPHQVTLIRGNHEASSLNSLYCGVDPHFRAFLENDENRKVLDNLYDTFSLTTYISEEVESGEREAVDFGHGLFDLSKDPSVIFNNNSPVSKMAISKKRELSQRVKQIAVDLTKDYPLAIASATTPKEKSQLEIEFAAKRITFLIKKDQENRTQPWNSGLWDISEYNWGDMDDNTNMGSLENRTWKLSPEDVAHYFRLISVGQKVCMKIRGHQHLKQHYKYHGRIVATTMPVGMDSPYNVHFFGQLDTAYILTTAPTVAGWTKTALLRKTGESITEVTQPYPLYSENT